MQTTQTPQTTQTTQTTIPIDPPKTNLKLALPGVRTCYAIRVTDVTGYSEIYRSVRSLAEALDVDTQQVRNALSHGWRLRACKLERLDTVDTRDTRDQGDVADVADLEKADEEENAGL